MGVRVEGCSCLVMEQVEEGTWLLWALPWEVGEAKSPAPNLSV